MRDRRFSSIGAWLPLVVTASARAETTAPPTAVTDRYELSAHSETYAELFRRALLPGPNGALVSTDTVAPIHQYVFLRARDLDTAWRKDSLDLEFAAWGRAWLGTRDAEPLFDGDVQTANVRYRDGPLALRLGRQVAAGGAARYVRFDGLALEVELGSGLDAKVYAGFTVLPRWNERPGYEHLGSAADSLLRDPEALPDPKRVDYRLGGARLGWASRGNAAGLSFHEQHERAGLAHRNLGLDGRARLLPEASLGGSAVVDLDRNRFSDARIWADTRPLPALDLSLEYLHTEPALFLSHQSVLSVFGSSSYEEAGASGTVRANGWLSFEGLGFVEFYASERPGARSEVAVRILADPSRRTFVRVAYARVLAADNGYHSLRSSLSRRFLPMLSSTLEAYAYFYDRAIRGYRSSTVYAGTLSFEPLPALSLLWGASLARSPYASFEAQTELRVAYYFDGSTRRQRP